MPLLPASTPAELMQSSSTSMSLDRMVDIILQACRGLQEANDHRVVSDPRLILAASFSGKAVC